MAHSVKSLADEWKCSQDKIRGLIAAGHLKAFSLGPRMSRIATEEAERMAAVIAASGFPPMKRRQPARPKTFVYIARTGDYIKIGYTSEAPMARIRSMQVGNPYPVALVGYAVGDRAAERYLHDLLAAHHHRREWFHMNSESWAAVCSFVSERKGRIYVRARHAA